MRLNVTRRRMLEVDCTERRPGGPILARRMRLHAICAALLLALALSACGAVSSSTNPQPPSATLVLDFTPNAVHAGIYEAIARA